MADFYAILGVQRDAEPAMIRRAFRKRVRAAHPDGGGSQNAFNELKTAYDILSDPDRRRAYDETGQKSGEAYNIRRTKIIELLSSALDQALLRLSKASTLEKDTNILRVAHKILLDKHQELDAQNRLYQQALEDARRLIDRFTIAEGENLMEAVVAGRVRACENQIQILDKHLKTIDAALDVLTKTSFDSRLEISTDRNVSTRPSNEMKRLYSLLDLGPLARFE